MIALRSRRGIVGAEFAASCTAVLILIVAIVDYGTLFSAKHAINYGLVKAARYAAVHSTTATTTNVTALFNAVVQQAIGPAAANCAFGLSYPSGNVVGGTVVVSAKYKWTSQSHLDALPAVTIAASQTLTITH